MPTATAPIPPTIMSTSAVLQGEQFASLPEPDPGSSSVHRACARTPPPATDIRDPTIIGATPGWLTREMSARRTSQALPLCSTWTVVVSPPMISPRTSRPPRSLSVADWEHPPASAAATARAMLREEPIGPTVVSTLPFVHSQCLQGAEPPGPLPARCRPAGGTGGPPAHFALTCTATRGRFSSGTVGSGSSWATTTTSALPCSGTSKRSAFLTSKRYPDR